MNKGFHEFSPELNGMRDIVAGNWHLADQIGDLRLFDPIERISNDKRWLQVWIELLCLACQELDR